MSWNPSEKCVTRLNIPNALERYSHTRRDIQLLTAAEDMILWARKQEVRRLLPDTVTRAQRRITPRILISILMP